MSAIESRIMLSIFGCAFLFGLWQGSIYAALWMASVIVFVCSVIDYLKDQPK
jgi:hypothetical protein